VAVVEHDAAVAFSAQLTYLRLRTTGAMLLANQPVAIRLICDVLTVFRLTFTLPFASETVGLGDLGLVPSCVAPCLGVRLEPFSFKVGDERLDRPRIFLCPLGDTLRNTLGASAVSNSPGCEMTVPTWKIGHEGRRFDALRQHLTSNL
jgi:hypothetical protein